ncbi:hypothetical protein [Micromonospora sp. IBHARD004]|uniref:hypothetical protein n=1 Tax=Micromonospora sp. IBHARD004 TaxID=3457764 RepID=UPI00405A40CE
MYERQRRDCAKLLRDLAVTIQDVRHKRPIPGSIYATEIARDNDVGDETCPHPFAFAHHLHRTLIYSAGERLATLAWCLELDPPHVLSMNDLARAAAEAAATAVWLGAHQADGDARLRRLVGLTSTAKREHSKLQTALKAEPDSSGMQEILDWATQNGVQAEGPGSKTDLLIAADAAAGRVDYNRLSAFTHSTLHAVMVGYIEIDQSQKGNSALVEVHAMQIGTVAASYVLKALAGLIRVNADDPALANRLRDRLDALLTEVAEAARRTEGLAG